MAGQMVRCTLGREYIPFTLEHFSQSMIRKGTRNKKLSCRIHTPGGRTEQKCNGPCGRWKSLDKFSHNSRKQDNPVCKDCTTWAEEVSPESGVCPEAPPGAIVYESERMDVLEKDLKQLAMNSDKHLNPDPSSMAHGDAVSSMEHGNKNQRNAEAPYTISDGRVQILDLGESDNEGSHQSETATNQRSALIRDQMDAGCRKTPSGTTTTRAESVVSTYTGSAGTWHGGPQTYKTYGPNKEVKTVVNKNAENQHGKKGKAPDMTSKWAKVSRNKGIPKRYRPDLSQAGREGGPNLEAFSDSDSGDEDIRYSQLC